METTEEFDIEYAHQIIIALRSSERKKVLTDLEKFLTPSGVVQLKRDAQRNIDDRLAMDIAIRELDAEHAAKKAL